MKKIILSLGLFSLSAFAAITLNSPNLSPSLNEYEQAKLVDENSTVFPTMAVLFPDSSGHSSLAANKFQPGLVSQVTGRQGPPLYKAAGGKLVPMVALVSMDGSDNPIPLALPASSLSLAVLKTGSTMSGALAMGTNKITGLGDPSAAQDAATKAYVDKIAAVNCSASSGGAASEALTCTGLVSTDTILAVSQSVPGANNTAIIGYNTLVNNGLTVLWTANPGANAIVKVLVKH